MGDSTEQQMGEEGKERGGRVQSLCKTSITSEKKKASRQTPPPLSSHHGDDGPPPHREQPLGSNRASQSVSVGEEYHDNHTEHTPYGGGVIPQQETVAFHSAATQELVVGGARRRVPLGAESSACVALTC